MRFDPQRNIGRHALHLGEHPAAEPSTLALDAYRDTMLLFADFNVKTDLMKSMNDITNVGPSRKSVDSFIRFGSRRKASQGARLWRLPDPVGGGARSSLVASGDEA